MSDLYEKQVKDGIINEYNKMKPYLSKKLNDFTVDFGIILKNKQLQNRPIDENKIINNKNNENQNIIEKIWMIEINHFPPIAGTPLFDINNQNDKDIFNGKKSFEFRYYKNNENVQKLQTSFPDIVPFVNVLSKKNENQEKKENEKKCFIL